MNNVSLLGRLTRDPEYNTSDSGTAFCKFSVAVNRDFKNASGEYEADFINCTAFRHTADFVNKYFSKGQMIGIVGRIQTRKWQKDDETRYSTEVIANSVDYAGEKKNNGAATVKPESEPIDITFGGELPMPEDLPF